MGFFFCPSLFPRTRPPPHFRRRCRRTSSPPPPTAAAAAAATVVAAAACAAPAKGKKGGGRREGGKGKEYLSRRRIRRFTPHAFTAPTFLIWTDQLSVVRRALLGIPLRWYAALPACAARAARCLRLLLYVLLWLRLLRCLLLRCIGTPGLCCSECCCCCLVATFKLMHQI